jgi:DnaJ-class molecular chaperone
MAKIIRCAYCNGTGKDPYDLLSAISHCLVCNGSGRIEVEEPMKKCVFCSGTGKNPLGARVTCIVCGGKGNNHCESNIKCIQCKGTGKSNDGLPCTRCKGIRFKLHPVNSEQLLVNSEQLNQQSTINNEQ